MLLIVESVFAMLTFFTPFYTVAPQAFLSVVKETVELVALEAASMALQEETDRIDALQQIARRYVKGWVTLIALSRAVSLHFCAD